MRNGTPLTLRPIRPEDEPLMVRFHQTLSQQSVYQRYFHVLDLSRRVEHERLIRRCFNDYDREIALVAEQRDDANGATEIVGIGRLVRIPGSDEAEFAILISDAVQGQGLGTELLRQLVEIGRAEGVHRITADILPDNRGMQHIAKALGFQLQQCIEDECVRAELSL
jgi:acetyltransferase